MSAARKCWLHSSPEFLDESKPSKNGVRNRLLSATAGAEGLDTHASLESCQLDETSIATIAERACLPLEGLAILESIRNSEHALNPCISRRLGNCVALFPTSTPRFLWQIDSSVVGYLTLLSLEVSAVGGGPPEFWNGGSIADHRVDEKHVSTT